MRPVRAALLALSLLLPFHAHATPGDTVSAALVHFFKAVSSSDAKDFASIFTDPATITDTFAPFVWQGPGGSAQYFTDLQTAIKTAGMTDVKLTPKPLKNPIEASNGFAYAPIPVDLSFKVNGESKTQTGMFVLGLRQTDAGWQVNTATWLYTQAGP